MFKSCNTRKRYLFQCIVSLYNSIAKFVVHCNKMNVQICSAQALRPAPSREMHDYIVREMRTL